MSGVKEIFSDSFKRSFLKSLNEGRNIAVSGAEGVSLEALAQDSSLPVRDYGVNSKIRRLFGKKQVEHTTIGGHPHFDSLEQGGQANGYVTTLFMDIKGSTRLGVVYDLQEVFYYKNSIIKCAIECIQAFDGHVHRIMGDAVLAFFRGDGNNPRDSAIDAINCGTYLVQFMKDIVQPEINNYGLAEDIGIRVGIDYGPGGKVLWGMYGYPGVSEVTATSFHVDVAAKLQQKAPKNRVMLGQSLCDMLDLPKPVIEYKLVNGDPERYVTPNYKGRDDAQINYRQYVLNHKKYFPLLPTPASKDKPIQISATIKSKSQVQGDAPFHSCARSVRKPYGITFKAQFYLAENLQNVMVNFRVENTGKEASEIKDPPNANHQTPIKAVRRDSGEYFASHWEDVCYTGLHFMHVSVWHEDRMIVSEQVFGVFVGENPDE
ncbi:adenylate/guanylate cyclase domain-containing protein [Pseudomonas soli]|uniref:adenylate/guanylate cyclase domain-containing protein n=2 Tax=Pseudomonas soli TaxID=1306993 RepID=UPI0028AA0AC3|nr:adenylate/guanylate cyclase domain-containing protein [Pseudomonas soli]